MPRFHFNILGDTPDPDLEGTEFPDIETAKCEARRYAGTRLSDSAFIADPDDEWRIEITDPTGLVLFRIDVTTMNAPVITR